MRYKIGLKQRISYILYLISTYLKKAAFVPYANKRQRRKLPLRYHSCSALWAALVCAVSGAPGGAYFLLGFGPLLGGDISGGRITASHQNGSSLKNGIRRDVSSSRHYL